LDESFLKALARACDRNTISSEGGKGRKETHLIDLTVTGLALEDLLDVESGHLDLVDLPLLPRRLTTVVVLLRLNPLQFFSSSSTRRSDSRPRRDVPHDVLLDLLLADVLSDRFPGCISEPRFDLPRAGNPVGFRGESGGGGGSSGGGFDSGGSTGGDGGADTGQGRESGSASSQGDEGDRDEGGGGDYRT
jgi:hypothetical protein